MVFTSMICILSIFFESDSKSRFVSLSLISATNDYFERYSLVLCQGILWKSHHFLGVLIHLSVTLLFLWLGIVFGRLFVRVVFIILWLFGFLDPNSHLFWCLNFFSILTTYGYATLSDEMSRKFISVWMYMCRSAQYFKTKCHSQSLIPILVHKVWKVLVNSGTSWPLSFRSVVHLMYWSS
jgi:hypothetical protein